MVQRSIECRREHIHVDNDCRDHRCHRHRADQSVWDQVRDATLEVSDGEAAKLVILSSLTAFREMPRRYRARKTRTTPLRREPPSGASAPFGHESAGLDRRHAFRISGSRSRPSSRVHDPTTPTPPRTVLDRRNQRSCEITIRRCIAEKIEWEPRSPCIAAAV